jgi:hypothetical protein
MPKEPFICSHYFYVFKLIALPCPAQNEQAGCPPGLASAMLRRGSDAMGAGPLHGLHLSKEDRGSGRRARACGHEEGEAGGAAPAIAARNPNVVSDNGAPNHHPGCSPSTSTSTPTTAPGSTTTSEPGSTCTTEADNGTMASCRRRCPKQSVSAAGWWMGGAATRTVRTTTAARTARTARAARAAPALEPDPCLTDLLHSSSQAAVLAGHPPPPPTSTALPLPFTVHPLEDSGGAASSTAPRPSLSRRVPKAKVHGGIVNVCGHS